MNPADEKTWSILTHVGGIFFGFVPALIAYLVFRERGPFIRHHTATALNFQLTMLIAAFVSSILLVTIILSIPAFLLLIAISIVIVVFSIIAAVTTNRGELYTYPLAIKFVN